MSEPTEPSSFRLVATMTAAGLLSGLALVVCYQVTKPRIAANEARALRDAVFEVLPGTADMEALVARDGALVPATAADADLPKIYAGRDAGGTPTGYAVPAQGAGFQDVIKVLFGYDPTRRTIVGLRILESRETPGLGDKIYKDAAFQENFTALAVDPGVTPVPRGKKTQPHEVDCITGATISSKAVARILDAGMKEWGPLLATPAVPEEVTP